MRLVRSVPSSSHCAPHVLLLLTSVAIGLIVLVRNYLEVYVYDKWVGKYLPEFEEGEQFMPTVCELREGQTTSPSLLTEADLVGLMDKNGIGVQDSLFSFG